MLRSDTHVAKVELLVKGALAYLALGIPGGGLPVVLGRGKINAGETRAWWLRKWNSTVCMSCVHIVEVQCLHPLSSLRSSLGEMEPSKIPVAFLS